MLGRDCICQFYKTICSSGILARFVQGVFYLKFVIFLAYASYVAVLVFYLPGGCTHTDTMGKQREARVRIILKSLEKTQYLMNNLYVNFTKLDHALLYVNFTKLNHICSTGILGKDCMSILQS